jgi:hypothetical protein
MKTHIITFSLFLLALSFTSCKKNEASATQTPSAAPATTPTTSTVTPPVVTAKDSVKTDEKGEKSENEANEKNERE